MDPDEVAREFITEVSAMVEAMPDDPGKFVLSGLAMQGIDPLDIDLDMPVSEAMELGVFRSRMKALIQNSDLPWEELKKRVQMRNIPSSLISRLVGSCLPTPAERKGSELNDMHLASLAAYADFTFVDRRMHDGFKQARRKNAELDGLCKRVERAASYRDIPGIVGSYWSGAI